MLNYSLANTTFQYVHVAISGCVQCTVSVKCLLVNYSDTTISSSVLATTPGSGRRGGVRTNATNLPWIRFCFSLEPTGFASRSLYACRFALHTLALICSLHFVNRRYAHVHLVAYTYNSCETKFLLEIFLKALKALFRPVVCLLWHRH